MKFWDISRTLANDLAPWPGDEPVHLKFTRTIADGAVVNLGAMSTSVHNGTHADARFHFDSSGETIDQVRLETYLGQALVVDLSKDFSNSGKNLIEIGDLQNHADAIVRAPRLLIKSGVWPNSRIFPKRIPVIAPGAAEWMQARGVKLLGLDLPSVDAIDAKTLNNHHALARAGIAIIESLDLSGVEPGFYDFAGLPLKISGGDGAPVRAVLWRK
jgi:arylformamidase